MWEQEIAKCNKNWEDTAAARTKNEVQSEIRKDIFLLSNRFRASKTSRWETTIPDRSIRW